MAKVKITTVYYDKTDINDTKPLTDEEEYSYTYDKMGNLASEQEQFSYTYENKYNKNGCLVSRKPNGGTPYKFTYKKIEVPTKYVEAIKKQQWVIVNGPTVFAEF